MLNSVPMFRDSEGFFCIQDLPSMSRSFLYSYVLFDLFCLSHMFFFKTVARHGLCTDLIC